MKKVMKQVKKMKMKKMKNKSLRLRQAAVFAYVQGTLEELSEARMVVLEGVELTPFGRTLFEELRRCGFSPTDEEINAAFATAYAGFADEEQWRLGAKLVRNCRDNPKLIEMYTAYKYN